MGQCTNIHIYKVCYYLIFQFTALLCPVGSKVNSPWPVRLWKHNSQSSRSPLGEGGEMSIAVALMRHHALHPEKSSASMPWMWDRWLEEVHAWGRNECQQSASDTARRDNGHNCSKTLLFRHRYLAIQWHSRQQGKKWCSNKDIFINRAFFYEIALWDQTWFVFAGKWKCYCSIFFTTTEHVSTLIPDPRFFFRSIEHWSINIVTWIQQLWLTPARRFNIEKLHHALLIIWWELRVPATGITMRRG